MKRRHFFRQIGLPLAAASVSSLTYTAESAYGANVPEAPTVPAYDSLKLAPINARADRITGIYTCTRPFRLAGPRIEMERLGQKNISVVPRSDGLIVQEIGNTGDFNNANATPDRSASESIVKSLAELLKV